MFEFRVGYTQFEKKVLNLVRLIVLIMLCACCTAIVMLFGKPKEDFINKIQFEPEHPVEEYVAKQHIPNEKTYQNLFEYDNFLEFFSCPFDSEYIDAYCRYFKKDRDTIDIEEAAYNFWANEEYLKDSKSNLCYMRNGNHTEEVMNYDVSIPVEDMPESSKDWCKNYDLDTEDIRYKKALELVNRALRMTKQNMRDVNRDGKFNCIDRALLTKPCLGGAKFVWVDCRYRNVDFNHLILYKVIDGFEFLIEPMSDEYVDARDWWEERGIVFDIEDFRSEADVKKLVRQMYHIDDSEYNFKY